MQDPEALLIFSGGMTRPHTDSTEASSYYRLAKSGNVFALEAESLRQAGEEVQAIEGDFERVTTEVRTQNLTLTSPDANGQRGAGLRAGFVRELTLFDCKIQGVCVLS